MKILRIEPCEEIYKRYTLTLNFNKDTGVLSGAVGTEGWGNTDLILDINLDLNKWVGQIVEARVVMTDQGYEVSYFSPMKNFAIANGMPTAPENKSELRLRLFRLYVKENIDDSIIQIIHGHEEVEGFENIVEDEDPSLRMYNLVRRDPDAAKYMKKARLKCDMLGVVDQRDSVSYLEAQVDILTRLVLELHKDDESQLVNILRQADEHSVLAIKGADALSQEFLKKKAWVRTVQKDYYDAKAKLEAETTPVKARYEVQP